MFTRGCNFARLLAAVLPVFTGLAVGGLASIGLTVRSNAGAAAYVPPSASYYIYGTYGGDWGYVNTLGCDQANYQRDIGINTFVILDFGGMVTNGGQLNFGTSTPMNQAQVVGLAEDFASGFTTCSQGTLPTWMSLALGTNNSITPTYAKGQAFGNSVQALGNWDNTYAYHIATWGAIDIEGGYSTVAAVTQWYYGYTSQTAIAYADFGSATGCTSYGSCSPGMGGWQTPGWYYNFAWQRQLAYSVPEVYTRTGSQARDWANVSSFGNNATGQPIRPWGPMDDYPLTSGSNTPPAAWSQLNTYFPGISYGFEITNT